MELISLIFRFLVGVLIILIGLPFMLISLASSAITNLLIGTGLGILNFKKED